MLCGFFVVSPLGGDEVVNRGDGEVGVFCRRLMPLFFAITTCCLI